MHKSGHSYLATFACLILLGALAADGRPARADQIVALVDEHGHKIYINTGEPTRGPVDWATRSFRPSRPKSSVTPPAEIHRVVEETADRFQIDPDLVHAIIQVESQYNPNAVSRKGAMGLMQLIPATAQRFGVGNPFDPSQNIVGGVNYLNYLLNLFGGDLSLSLAAYNAGENAVMRHGGIPSFAETVDYVRKVTDLYKSKSPAGATKPNAKEPFKAPIYRYVDARGIVHYTNVE